MLVEFGDEGRWGTKKSNKRSEPPLKQAPEVEIWEVCLSGRVLL